MKFILLLTLLNCHQVLASGPRHMITISPTGFGTSAAFEKFSPEANSPYEKFNIFSGNVAINYAYAIKPHLQLGGFLSNQSNERSYETQDGKKGKFKYNTLLIGAAVIWNFQDNLERTCYTGLVVSFLNHEEEFSKNLHLILEDDRNAESFEFVLGKRYSLSNFGIQNISYSPSLSTFSSHSRKDYEDDGIENSFGFAIQPIKFDVLF